jgi:hypothetical protein
MDFPVCPACHQSVIDDDAVDCPFCGASMKAKPGAKPAATAAKPSAVSAKPASARPVAVKPTLPGDDLPFESELTSGKSAIPAMPNPTKQRSWQVICPMCDTPGYLPPNAAGQDVRCANPKCVMPVFTAPAPKKKEEAPPPPPPKSSNLPLIGGIFVVVVLLFGAGLYFAFFGLGGKPIPKGMSEEDKQLMAEMAGNKKAPVAIDTKAPVPGVNKKGGPDRPGVTAPGTEELIQSALKQMKDSSLASEKQRSKPYCRQLAAEANAILGNAVAAREHLDQLLRVGSEVSYYRIEPLLELFWGELGAGKKKEATSTLNNAMTEVPKIPKFGRTRLEIAGRLAAALAAADRIPEAITLLSNFAASDANAQLAARLQMTMDGKVGRLQDTYSVLPWTYPQAVAATASLITRGQLEKAAAWAASQSTDEAKAECLAVWAEEIAHRRATVGEVDADGVIAAAVKPLAPALAARVWARAGCGRLLAKDQAGVNAAISLAQLQLATVTIPAELKMPDDKLILSSFKLPPAAPLMQAATAAGEITFLQAQSLDLKASAEQSLDQALAFVRGTSPSFAAAQQRDSEADRLGASGLRDMLKSKLKLSSDDKARSAATKYRSALAEIFEASQTRFEMETGLLSRLRGAGAGLNTKVWIIVNTRSNADDINQRDNFFATPLPGELIEGLKGTDEERALLGAWGLRSKETAPPRPPFVELSDRLKTNAASAVEYLQSLETKGNRREELALRVASLLPTFDNLPVAFQFITRLDDTVLREDCYRLAGALAAQRGQADAVWRQVSAVQQQTEKEALCRGLIGGLQSVGKVNDELPDPEASRLK